MKSTPGPWTVDATVALGAMGVWTDYATHPGHDGAGYGSQICSMLPETFDILREQRDANAKLIAAAPDMLEALNAAMPILTAYIHPDEFDGHAARALLMVREALAKAEGQP